VNNQAEQKNIYAQHLKMVRFVNVKATVTLKLNGVRRLINLT